MSARTGLVINQIHTERLRQMSVEGWTEEHDDGHSGGELAIAGACYACNSTVSAALYPVADPPVGWPWGAEWWKPRTPRQDLIKAAALIVAEIERLDRAEEG